MCVKRFTFAHFRLPHTNHATALRYCLPLLPYKPISSAIFCTHQQIFYATCVTVYSLLPASSLFLSALLSILHLLLCDFVSVSVCATLFVLTPANCVNNARIVLVFSWLPTLSAFLQVICKVMPLGSHHFLLFAIACLFITSLLAATFQMGYTILLKYCLVAG